MSKLNILPDVRGLLDRESVIRNRILAENALRECCTSSNWDAQSVNDLQLQPSQESSLQRYLQVIPSLYAVNPVTSAELFFRPVVGNGIDIPDVVMEMFNSKGEELL